jgi:hypothetical protein
VATSDRLGPRGRRTLYAALAALVAVTAVILILMGSAPDESANSTSNPVAADNSNSAAPTVGLTAQSYSVALPSCCYPVPVTVPANPAAPAA